MSTMVSLQLVGLAALLASVAAASEQERGRRGNFYPSCAQLFLEADETKYLAANGRADQTQGEGTKVLTAGEARHEDNGEFFCMGTVTDIATGLTALAPGTMADPPAGVTDEWDQSFENIFPTTDKTRLFSTTANPGTEPDQYYNQDGADYGVDKNVGDGYADTFWRTHTPISETSGTAAGRHSGAFQFILNFNASTMDPASPGGTGSLIPFSGGAYSQTGTGTTNPVHSRVLRAMNLHRATTSARLALTKDYLSGRWLRARRTCHQQQTADRPATTTDRDADRGTFLKDKWYSFDGATAINSAHGRYVPGKNDRPEGSQAPAPKAGVGQCFEPEQVDSLPELATKTGERIVPWQDEACWDAPYNLNGYYTEIDELGKRRTTTTATDDVQKKWQPIFQCPALPVPEQTLRDNVIATGPTFTVPASASHCCEVCWWDPASVGCAEDSTCDPTDVVAKGCNANPNCDGAPCDDGKENTFNDRCVVTDERELYDTAFNLKARCIGTPCTSGGKDFQNIMESSEEWGQWGTVCTAEPAYFTGSADWTIADITTGTINVCDEVECTFGAAATKGRCLAGVCTSIETFGDNTDTCTFSSTDQESGKQTESTYGENKGAYGDTCSEVGQSNVFSDTRSDSFLTSAYADTAFKFGTDAASAESLKINYRPTRDYNDCTGTPCSLDGADDAYTATCQYNSTSEENECLSGPTCASGPLGIEHAAQECADVAYCDTDFHRYKYFVAGGSAGGSEDPGWMQAADPDPSTPSAGTFGGEDAPGYPNPEFDIADVDPYCAPMGDLVVDSVTSTVTARANFYECTGDVMGVCGQGGDALGANCKITTNTAAKKSSAGLDVLDVVETRASCLAKSYTDGGDVCIFKYDVTCSSAEAAAANSDSVGGTCTTAFALGCDRNEGCDGTTPSTNPLLSCRWTKAIPAVSDVFASTADNTCKNIPAPTDQTACDVGNVAVSACRQRDPIAAVAKCWPKPGGSASCSDVKGSYNAGVYTGPSQSDCNVKGLGACTGGLGAYCTKLGLAVAKELCVVTMVAPGSATPCTFVANTDYTCDMNNWMAVASPAVTTLGDAAACATVATPTSQDDCSAITVGQASANSWQTALDSDVAAHCLPDFLDDTSSIGTACRLVSTSWTMGTDDDITAADCAAVQDEPAYCARAGSSDADCEAVDAPTSQFDCDTQSEGLCKAVWVGTSNTAVETKCAAEVSKASCERTLDSEEIAKCAWVESGECTFHAANVCRFVPKNMCVFDAKNDCIFHDGARAIDGFDNSQALGHAKYRGECSDNDPDSYGDRCHGLNDKGFNVCKGKPCVTDTAPGNRNQNSECSNSPSCHGRPCQDGNADTLLSFCDHHEDPNNPNSTPDGMITTCEPGWPTLRGWVEGIDLAAQKLYATAPDGIPLHYAYDDSCDLMDTGIDQWKYNLDTSAAPSCTTGLFNAHRGTVNVRHRGGTAEAPYVEAKIDESTSSKVWTDKVLNDGNPDIGSITQTESTAKYTTKRGTCRSSATEQFDSPGASVGMYIQTPDPQVPFNLDDTVKTYTLDFTDENLNQEYLQDVVIDTELQHLVKNNDFVRMMKVHTLDDGSGSAPTNILTVRAGQDACQSVGVGTKPGDWQKYPTELECIQSPGNIRETITGGPGVSTTGAIVGSIGNDCEWTYDSTAADDGRVKPGGFYSGSPHLLSCYAGHSLDESNDRFYGETSHDASNYPCDDGNPDTFNDKCLGSRPFNWETAKTSLQAAVDELATNQADFSDVGGKSPWTSTSTPYCLGEVCQTVAGDDCAQNVACGAETECDDNDPNTFDDTCSGAVFDSDQRHQVSFVMTVAIEGGPALTSADATRNKLLLESHLFNGCNFEELPEFDFTTTLLTNAGCSRSEAKMEIVDANFVAAGGMDITGDEFVNAVGYDTRQYVIPGPSAFAKVVFTNAPQDPVETANKCAGIPCNVIGCRRDCFKGLDFSQDDSCRAEVQCGGAVCDDGNALTIGETCIAGTTRCGGGYIYITAAPVPVAVSTPMPVPVSVPVAVPTSVPVSVPVAVPVSVPVAVPTSVPVSVPVAVPTSVPVSVPVAVPGPPSPSLNQVTDTFTTYPVIPSTNTYSTVAVNSIAGGFTQAAYNALSPAEQSTFQSNAAAAFVALAGGEGGFTIYDIAMVQITFENTRQRQRQRRAMGLMFNFIFKANVNQQVAIDAAAVLESVIGNGSGGSISTGTGVSLSFSGVSGISTPPVVDNNDHDHDNDKHDHDGDGFNDHNGEAVQDHNHNDEHDHNGDGFNDHTGEAVAHASLLAAKVDGHASASGNMTAAAAAVLGLVAAVVVAVVVRRRQHAHNDYDDMASDSRAGEPGPLLSPGRVRSAPYGAVGN